jgi:predicted nucleic acid-binding protein
VVGPYTTSQAHPWSAELFAGDKGTAGLTVIVLDASVVVELLTNGALADSIRKELSGHDESFIVPHLIDVEVMSAIRRLAAGQRIGADRRDQFLTGLAALPAERYSHTPLIERIWELRQNFTACDATYIALAEATNAVLYTSDEKLCKGHRARVVLFTH